MLTPLKFRILEKDENRFLPHPKTGKNEFAPVFNLNCPDFKGVGLKENTLAAYAKTIEDGIFQTQSFNFEGYIDIFSHYQELKNVYIGNDGFPTKTPDFHNYISLYGVADNIKQVKEHFKRVIDSTPSQWHNEFVISYVVIDKKTEPKEGGWRWHKWGPYIGKRTPKCEYIVNEPRIRKVICFKGHYIKRKRA